MKPRRSFELTRYPLLITLNMVYGLPGVRTLVASYVEPLACITLCMSLTTL